ncbi:hypothetical protein WJX74_007180 [Apatococcus lobatus]|uniref:Uncharacterized protein n=1 Tax=Apatococcus lobatus TaxID=904363 RepID=A0AAW1RAB4_9CHLO
MSLSLSETQAFLSKQAQLWQSHSTGLSETCQDLQALRDEEAQAVLQLEAEKAVRFLQRQLIIWSSAAKGQLEAELVPEASGNSLPTPEPKNFRERLAAMGAAPILGFDVQAAKLAKQRASLLPTDGRAAMEVQAAASSTASDGPQPDSNSPPEVPQPASRSRPQIPMAQRTSESRLPPPSMQNELASIFARRRAASVNAAG